MINIAELVPIISRFKRGQMFSICYNQYIHEEPPPMLSNQEQTQLQEVILRQSPPDLKLNLPLNDLKERYESGERSFVGEDFNSSDLSGLTLIGCDFCNSNFFQTDLNKCNLDKCDFRGANLREANLRETSLKKADLTGSRPGDGLQGLERRIIRFWRFSISKPLSTFIPSNA